MKAEMSYVKLVFQSPYVQGLKIMKNINKAMIKSYVESACVNKEPKYCRKWKIHCDVQLYKVLELQFLIGLEDSESVMP